MYNWCVQIIILLNQLFVCHCEQSSHADCNTVQDKRLASPG